MNLRDYQLESIQQLRDGILDGHLRQVLCAPTGAGKTVCAAHLLAEASAKGRRAAMLVDRIALVKQTSDVLWSHDIQHGVAQGSNTFGRHEPIQVLSQQTMERRDYLTQVDLLVVDEAHTMRQRITDMVKASTTPVIGLTATPFTKGMGEVYSNIVNVTTTDALIAQGFLSPLKVYAAKEIDMTGAKVVAGEWSDKDITERGIRIVGDIVKEWMQKTALHFGRRPKTLVFSATVDHGAALCAEFQASGLRFEQVSYKDGNDDRRAALIEEFRGDTDLIGLVSCEALAKGFDVPAVECMVSARPYRKSFSGHIQQIGRGMRTSPGKEFCLLLDHSGNYLGFQDRMLDLFANGVHALDDGKLMDKEPRKEREKKKDLICSCGYVLSPKDDFCPACGKERKRTNTVEAVAGELLALGTVEVPAWMRDRGSVWRQICHIAQERKPHDQDAARKFALVQYRNLYGSWPQYGTPFNPASAVDYRLANKVLGNVIRYAKAMKRRA